MYRERMNINCAVTVSQSARGVTPGCSNQVSIAPLRLDTSIHCGSYPSNWGAKICYAKYLFAIHQISRRRRTSRGQIGSETSANVQCLRKPPQSREKKKHKRKTNFLWIADRRKKRKPKAHPSVKSSKIQTLVKSPFFFNKTKAGRGGPDYSTTTPTYTTTQHMAGPYPEHCIVHHLLSVI